MYRLYHGRRCRSYAGYCSSTGESSLLIHLQRNVADNDTVGRRGSDVPIFLLRSFWLYMGHGAMDLPVRNQQSRHANPRCSGSYIYELGMSSPTTAPIHFHHPLSTQY